MADKKRGSSNSEPEWLEKIKKLVVVAMFADDLLMERFVLKGGNALDLIHGVSTRASVDIDLSMEDEFDPEKLEEIRGRVERSLKETFRAEAYEVFDVTLLEKPAAITADLAGFWGGYQIEFKLIERTKFHEHQSSIDALRRNALKIGARGKFQIDISKFEYCKGKQPQELNGYQIFVYTPEMIVAEKLRAICQQMPEYGAIVKKGRPGTARARDFLDIYTLIERFRLDMTTELNRALISNVFEAKKVPIGLLGRVNEYRDFHLPDFLAVRDTVKPGMEVKDFDFYFDFVVELCGRLKSLWNM